MCLKLGINSMKNKVYSYALIVFAILHIIVLYGCGGSTNEIVQLVSERDSLRQVNKLNEIRWNSINEMLTVVNSTVDSISMEEGLIFVSGNGESQITRMEALKNLERFESLVLKQHERIKDLEYELHGNAALDSNSLGVISLLKSQLLEKDRQIAYLKNELQKKDVDISKLREKVASQQLQINMQEDKIVDLTNRNERQTKALLAQDAMINQCYVLIGTKKDLERKNVLRKGKLRPEGALDRSKFATVDIRTWTEISFTAKKVKILTPMPSQTYVLNTDGNHNYTLTIKDPNGFWNVSNFLVIQTD